MLFLAAVLFTVSEQYFMFFIAQILYTSGFIFKQMDNVILIKNLNYLNKSEEYIDYQSKGSTLYAMITLIISLFSGILFNINNYIPMILCIGVCFINIIICNFFYEVKSEENTEKKTQNFKFSKILILIILLFGLFYSAISIGQTNSKLFMQSDMNKFLETEQIAIYLSIFITISRIARMAANILFMKVYKKIKNSMLELLEIGLVCAFVLLLLGHFIGNGMIGIIVMALGFFMFLAIRDPFNTFMRKICFDNCKQENHDKAIIYLTLSRKIGDVIFSGIVAMILTKFDYVFVMTFMLVITFMYMFLIRKINKLISTK